MYQDRTYLEVVLFFFIFLLGPKEQAALFQLTVNSEVFAMFYFRETSYMQNFVKIKLSRNGEITLLFTCPSHKCLRRKYVF